MDSKKIEQFLILSDQLNYSKAADILNMTQPTLSRNIISMESELGVVLFDRTTTKMRLTPAGEYLAKNMRYASGHFHSMVQHALALQSGLSGRIRVGITKGQSLYTAKRVLQAYHKRHPEIIFDLVSENLSTLRRMLDNHTLDFAIGYGIDYNYPSRYSNKPICHTRLNVVVSKDHPLAGRPKDSLRLRDFRNDTFLIVPESETLSIRYFNRMCGKAGFEPKTVEYPDFLSIALGIEAGYGIAVLTSKSIAYGNPAFEFVVVPDFKSTEREPTDMALFWANDNDSVINQAFIAYLEKLPFDNSVPR